MFHPIVRPTLRAGWLSSRRNLGSTNVNLIKTLAKDSTVESGLEPSGTSSLQRQVINPLEHHDFFGVRDLVCMDDLYRARVHMGHKEGTRNPHMLPYLFGCRLGVDIIDLEQTLPLLQDALNFTAHIAYLQGIILLVSRHLQTMPMVERAARECGEYAHCRFWRASHFTNAKLYFGEVTRMPDLVILLSVMDNVFQEHRAVLECAKLLIPTIGIVDTAGDPRLITYPVPGNDDTPTAVELYLRLFKEAIIQGKAKRQEMDPDKLLS